jgi:D-glycero-D-manno-heptose 1,7-bisphosphate phosphatase
MTAVALLILDIDGTVRKGFDELGRFVNGPKDVEIFPEVPDLMREWKARGGRIIGASNQGGISLGYVTMENVLQAMALTHRLTGMAFDKIAFCQHHPDAKDPEHARCWCRKPRPGLVIEAALDLARRTDEFYPPHMALFVGDRDEDRLCAEALNIDFMLAADWRRMGSPR